MVNLMSHSNAITKGSKSSGQKKLVGTALLVFLTATSLLSIGSCRQNAAELKKVKEDNKDLRKDVEYYQKDALETGMEKNELQSYANTAHTFVNEIEPEKWKAASPILGITDKEHQEQLLRLQKGWWQER